MNTHQVEPTTRNSSLRIGQYTACGPYRSSNADAIAVHRFAHFTLALVADGMGGNGMGAIASQRALEVVSGELCCRLSPLAGEDEARWIIRKAVLNANTVVEALAVEEDGRTGSTLVLAVWRKYHHAYITHEGDSRAYLLRADRMEQLTQDHTVARALLDTGEITSEEASRFHSVLFRYLGSKECAPDIQTLDLHANDRLLLCTDGLHGPAPQEDIQTCLRTHSDNQTAAEALVQLALERGSRDNVSCIVLEVVEEPTDPDAPANPDGSGLADRSWLGWNDGCAVQLARAIHAAQSFEDMPILADALEEAGCPSEYLVGHCREPGPHMLECWALRWLLGKEPPG